METPVLDFTRDQIIARIERGVKQRGLVYHGRLERVHFPTGRVPLEAVMRLLIERFSVPSNTAPEVGRRALALREPAFEEIAHRPLSGLSA